MLRMSLDSSNISFAGESLPSSVSFEKTYVIYGLCFDVEVRYEFWYNVGPFRNVNGAGPGLGVAIGLPWESKSAIFAFEYSVLLIHN